jgi:hypothetical protein
MSTLTPEERAAKAEQECDHQQPAYYACPRCVAYAIREAEAAEREACAKEADEGWWNDSNGDSRQTAKDIAAAIRARGTS